MKIQVLCAKGFLRLGRAEEATEHLRALQHAPFVPSTARVLTCLLQRKTVPPVLARVTQGRFPCILPETFAAFEDASRAKPERVFRLFALVQAAADQSESVRDAVLRLAKAGSPGSTSPSTYPTGA